MMGKDFTGQKFGHLMAVRRIGTKYEGLKKRAVWLFSCDCGGSIEWSVHQARESPNIGCRDCKSARRSASAKNPLNWTGRQRNDLTAEEVRYLLNYDPRSGELTWRNPPNRNIKIGDVAGILETDGYRRIGIGRIPYAAHRLAFLHMTGRWPSAEIDHRDLDRSNNRWQNLREATDTQNQGNKRKPRHNTTGFKGVMLSKSRKGFVAVIGDHGRSIRLGTFDCPVAAHLAYVVAADKYFGEFARAA